MQTFFESTLTHRESDGRTRPEYRLRGNSIGFWVERRRSTIIVDRVMSVYDRIDTYWTQDVNEAIRRFLRIPGVA